jgi:amino acid transporter
MFVGFDVIPQAASEMDVPLKKIPKLLIWSIIAAAMWYILMILATCLSAPEAIRVDGVIPVADSMAYAYGSPLWGKICIIGALCGIITSWNGFLFGAARCLYSMAKEGLLPEFLAKTHTKYQTPVNAILFCGGVCAVTAFLGQGALTWFVDASSFGTVIMYGMVVLAFILLRRDQPDLERPYKITNARFVGFMSVLVVLFFVYLYLPFGPSSLSKVEWGMVLGWFIAGIILSLFARKKES